MLGAMAPAILPIDGVTLSERLHDAVEDVIKRSADVLVMAVVVRIVKDVGGRRGEGGGGMRVGG